MQNHHIGFDEAMPLPRALDHQSSCSSLPITPAADAFVPTTVTTRSASVTPNESLPASDEVLRLKLELAQAQSKITRLDQELAQTRIITQHSGRSTPGITSDPEFPLVSNDSPMTSRLPPIGGPSSKPTFSRDNSWSILDEVRSDHGDPVASGQPSRNRNIWNKQSYQNSFSQGPPPMHEGQQPMPWGSNRSSNQSYPEPPFSPSPTDGYRLDRMTPDHESMRSMGGRRGSRFDTRFPPSHNFSSNYGGFGNNMVQFDPSPAYPASGNGPLPSSVSGNTSSGVGMGVPIYPSYQQQPVGTPLSPHATEFTSAGTPWKTAVSGAYHARTGRSQTNLTKSYYQPITPEGQTFLPATEPLNYRRLLDRNVTCDWKYIVDKIVCNNDQQASIFLQQKLKVGTPPQKYDIVEAIVAQAYPLMVNRFGNFLVQRCFEHGTPEQVIKIAEGIRGNTLNLSMDPFGCHVVQKAFDSVPEDYKAIMVHELLRRIPETVIHRYACHVWQKLFELRWTESPPQIMNYVNDALRGMWHEVALGETGSLVVQNIFENCLEEDKV
jgi:hypothetical protein